MDNSNVKKRKTMSFDEFVKNKVGIEKGDHKLVDDNYSGEKKGDAGVNTLEEPKKIKIVKENNEWKIVGDLITETWKDKVQKVYNSLEELQGYDEMYGIAKRLGYKNADELWSKNPTISGSTDPKDLKVVKESYEVNTDTADMAEETAKAVISRAIDMMEQSDDMDAPSGSGSIDLKAAFDAETDDIPDGMGPVVAETMRTILKNMLNAAKDPMLGK